MVAKTTKMKTKTTTKSIQKSSSNATLAAKTAARTTKKNTKNKTKKNTPKEEKPNSSKFGMHRAGTADAKNTASSVFERSVANFPKFDAEAGSSVYGVSSLSHKTTSDGRWIYVRIGVSFTWFPSS